MQLYQPRFAFVTVNPMMSGLTFAAENLGGELLGSSLVPAPARIEYEAFFGRGACRDPYELADIVVGELPFSMFVQGERPDPAVRDVLLEARRLSNNAQYLLFRVNWADSTRLGVVSKGYLEAAAGVFSSGDWFVEQVMPGSDDNLFIGIKRRSVEKSKRRRKEEAQFDKADLSSVATWWGDLSSETETLVLTGGSVVPFGLNEGSFEKSPQETLLDKGYPEAYALHHAKADVKLINAAVDVGEATKALVALLKVGE